jgi:hypothetical protein
MLEHDCCLTAFEINEDKFIVHSGNHSIGASRKINNIIEDMMQSSNIKANDEEKSKTIGEEPSE